MKEAEPSAVVRKVVWALVCAAALLFPIIYFPRQARKEIIKKTFDELNLSARADSEYAGKMPPHDVFGRVYEVVTVIRDHRIVEVRVVGDHDKQNVEKVSKELFSKVVDQQTLNVAPVPEPVYVSKMLLLAIEDSLKNDGGTPGDPANK